MKTLLMMLTLSLSSIAFGQLYTPDGKNIMEVIKHENPCKDKVGNAISPQALRTYFNTAINLNVRPGAHYVGVTPEGDIMVISNNRGRVEAQMLICPRPNLTGSGSFSGEPVLNSSFICPVSEITASNLVLDAENGLPPYILSFAPIHIPGTERVSELCIQEEKLKVSDQELDEISNPTLPSAPILGTSGVRVIRN